MAVVLGREELIPRSERAIDLADVDDASLGIGYRHDVLGHVGEGHECRAFRHGRNRPIWNTQKTQSGGSQTSFQNLSTDVLCGCHVRHPALFTSSASAAKALHPQTRRSNRPVLAGLRVCAV